ncbi:4a-hydroxytetrahydrobiopterin dehydratase [Rhizobium sp. L1K21]|uniref:4a-hydroxytetrahydrobiopterin dehydratase n=1 Tax=Rhizobium sp. L1K21 TaxID=2954933 RepID=UPI002092AAE2|nr:4a-hydroxytetrahydrobiopterin dehydratase [Rhizobium sp. L1K21]MCO6184740.1 4a-hydroxytetrahydrobiopterin dehydratase [Rhizobium sp. L1K21]
MEQQPLETSEVEEMLEKLNGWQVEDGGKAISRDFKFANFREAFAFMTESALMAEKMDHHPEWSNVYSSVSVRLTTHSANGLTKLDFKLAKAMDKAARAI